MLASPQNAQRAIKQEGSQHRMRSFARMAIGAQEFCKKYPQNKTWKNPKL